MCRVLIIRESISLRPAAAEQRAALYPSNSRSLNNPLNAVTWPQSQSFRRAFPILGYQAGGTAFHAPQMTAKAVLETIDEAKRSRIGPRQKTPRRPRRKRHPLEGIDRQHFNSFAVNEIRFRRC